MVNVVVKSKGKCVCNNSIHFSSVSNRLMFLNLVEFESPLAGLYNIMGRMTGVFKMLIKKGINILVFVILR